MALQIDITDIKGVKTRYHRVRSITLAGDTIEIKMRGYVNQATRDAEKNALKNNEASDAYDRETEQIRQQLDALSAQLQPNGEGDPAVIEQIKELSQQVNDRTSNTARPQWTPVVDRYYDETDITLPVFEPLTLDGIYQRLAAAGKYAGASNI